MRTGELKYEYKFNRGNYEHELISISAFVDEKEAASEVMKRMIKFVEAKGDFPLENTPKEEKLPPVKVAEIPASAPEAEVVKEEVKSSPPPIAKATKKETEERQAREKAEKEAKFAKENPPPPKKVFKSKAATYDRTLDLHKKLVAEMLDSKVKNWKAIAAKAKEQSTSMNGMAFLDDEGRVLESFSSEFIAGMK
jgi:hypothetical protein